MTGTGPKPTARYSIIPSRAFHDPDLTPTDIRVLGVLGYHLNSDNLAWPSQTTIADSLGLRRQSVNRCLQRLAEAKYIKIIAQRRSNGAQAPSKYLVHLDPVVEPQDMVDDVAPDTSDGEQSHPTVTPQSHPAVTGGVTAKGDRGCHRYGDSTKDELPIRTPHKNAPVPDGTASGELFLEEEISPNGASTQAADERPQNADNAPNGDHLLKSVIFSAGVGLLAGQGIAQGSARSFLGRLIKNSSAKIVADCVNAACVENPIDVRSWLRQAVETRAVRSGLRKASDASPAARDEAERARMADLDRRFARIASGQSWQPAWGHDPRIADEGYPPELYEKHGIERPGALSRRRA